MNIELALFLGHFQHMKHPLTHKGSSSGGCDLPLGVSALSGIKFLLSVGLALIQLHLIQSVRQAYQGTRGYKLLRRSNTVLEWRSY